MSLIFDAACIFKNKPKDWWEYRAKLFGYRTEDLHNLDRLLKLSQCFSAEPSAVFPRETHEEKRLFSLFHKSYSDARYKLGFKISGENAAALLEKCREFAALTERLCLQKIEEFGLEAGGKSEYGHTAWHAGVGIL